MEGCFDRFGEGAPEEVAVRFEIDKTGRVTSAQIHPREIEPGKLGVCLSELARTTKFPQQNRAVAFRIPLRIAR